MLFGSVAPIEKGRAEDDCDAGTGEPRFHAGEACVINVGFSCIFTSTSFKHAEISFRTLGLSSRLRNLKLMNFCPSGLV